MIKKLLAIIAVSSTSLCSAAHFATEGNHIKNIALASIDDKSALYLSELDGTVSAYTQKGKLLWRNQTQDKAVLFEIKSVDIDGDNDDDLLAASADGNVYAWKSNGELLWAFNPGHKVRFSEIAVVNNKNKVQIFAGGNDYFLYELNTEGEQVSATPIKGAVRSIEGGDFNGDGVENLLLMTYAHDKFRWEFFGLLDASSKKVIKSVSYKAQSHKKMSRFMLTDLSVDDVNGDGKDDVLLFGDISFMGNYFRLDENLNIHSSFAASKKQRQRYAHSQGAFDAVNKQVIMRHGGIVYALNPNNSKLNNTSGSIYQNTAYNDFVIDNNKQKLLLAGEVSGGNSVYSIDLSNKQWIKEVPKSIGRMQDVEKNISTLYKQTLEFVPPAYQKRSTKPWMMIAKSAPEEVMALNGADLNFIKQEKWDENTDRTYLVNLIGKSALKRDKRAKYDLTREQIINKAKQMEKKGTPFILWAGHGNDPFFLHIETMEKILEVAPNTCHGFLYAEMHDTKDPRVIHYVNEYIPRLAKAIRKEGRAKLYFRYKNMFWGASSHLQPWKDMFYSGKYADILVPASEDTSSRTQEINLAGRVGMHSGGYIDDFAMRIVDDNPTSWRPLTPGGQKSVSSYLRQGAMMAAYGARYGILFANKYLDENMTYAPLLALMKSGVIPITEPEDILSIGSWHLMNGVDEHLIHSIDDHHNMIQYESTDDDAVMSYGQMHWAGTNLPEHDYSKIALGVDYRWVNYMPTMPNGMVPIAPMYSKVSLEKANIPFSVSDTKYGYVNGKKVPAKAYAKVLREKVKQGAESMPVVVKGASWSAIRLDDKHTRIILADPGYLDPQDREVTVHFNHKSPQRITDILSKEQISASGNRFSLTVPAGSMRFIDLAY